MGIISRYLLSNYLKVLFFCVFSFLAILLTTRLQEIAQFAALGAPAFLVFLFALYQIPYVLPVAIPVACLISSILLVQRLSTSNELTALRASGRSLKKILTPIICASIVLAGLNFYIVSELATQAHLATRLLEKQLRSINPLVLLQNKHLSDLKGIYVQSMHNEKDSNNVKNMVLAIWNRSNQRISLLFAREISVEEQTLVGKNFTLITGKPAADPNGYDHLGWENIEKIRGSVDEFSLFLRPGSWHIHSDYLKMSLLLVHVNKQWQALNEAKGESQAVIKKLKKQLNRTLAEFSRRFSLTFSVVGFTLMGASFGIRVGRYTKYRGLYFVIGLATLYLVCFFFAKGFQDHLIVATVLYTVPLLIMSGCSIHTLYKASRGIE